MNRAVTSGMLPVRAQVQRMRRISTYLWRGVVLCSGVLWITFAVLWWYGYAKPSAFPIADNEDSEVFIVAHGRLGTSVGDSDGRPLSPRALVEYWERDGCEPPDFDWADDATKLCSTWFGFESGAVETEISYLRISWKLVPVWALIIVSSVAPAGFVGWQLARGRLPLETIFCLASLLLLTISCVGWIRSYQDGDGLRFSGGDGEEYEFSSFAGQVGISYGNWISDFGPGGGWEGTIWPLEREKWFSPGLESDWRFGGFDLVFMRESSGFTIGHGTLLVIPYWFLCVTGLIIPLRVLQTRARRYRYFKRIASGRCGHCGYDLRATPERCSECGRQSTKVGSIDRRTRS